MLMLTLMACFFRIGDPWEPSMVISVTNDDAHTQVRINMEFSDNDDRYDAGGDVSRLYLRDVSGRSIAYTTFVDDVSRVLCFPNVEGLDILAIEGVYETENTKMVVSESQRIGRVDKVQCSK